MNISKLGGENEIKAKKKWEGLRGSTFNQKIMGVFQ